MYKSKEYKLKNNNIEIGKNKFRLCCFPNLSYQIHIINEN